MTTLFDTIKKETKQAIDRSYEGANGTWRKKTMENLMIFLKENETFTMNDFREFNSKNCEFETHDNRAMGGIMQTAKGLSWIKPTGQTIISRVGHKSLLQVWKSLLFKSNRV